jgi:hypothetical protein
MKLQCENCDVVLEAGTVDSLHAAMTKHTTDVHGPELFAGKSPIEMRQMLQQMDVRVRQAILDQS